MLRYNGVLNTSMSLITNLYIGFGFFGYLKYGEEIKGCISLNLPPSDILAQVRRCAKLSQPNLFTELIGHSEIIRIEILSGPTPSYANR